MADEKRDVERDAFAPGAIPYLDDLSRQVLHGLFAIRIALMPSGVAVEINSSLPKVLQLIELGGIPQIL